MLDTLFNTSCMAPTAFVLGPARLLAKDMAPQESPDIDAEMQFL